MHGEPDTFKAYHQFMLQAGVTGSGLLHDSNADTMLGQAEGRKAKNVSMTSLSDVEMRECICMPGGAGQVPGSDDVSGSPGGGADVDSRSRQYAEILGKQRDVAGSHNHLDKV